MICFMCAADMFPSFSLLQVALGSPGMWSYKSCQYYVCYLVMILVLVSSTHSHPSSPRTKGHNIDKHVLQRYLQMRTLANHKVNINGFRQTLDKLEHIYSHKGRWSKEAPSSLSVSCFCFFVFFYTWYATHSWTL